MKMIDYLDRDRDRILAGLKGAHSPAEAQQVLEKETDRLLLQYNVPLTLIGIAFSSIGIIVQADKKIGIVFPGNKAAGL